jgi:hypothetical protein
VTGDLMHEGCDAVRVLTVRDPWANLIADGRKQWETRTRATKWRGWVVIHAGVAMTRPQRDLCARLSIDPKTVAKGRVVAIARLVECVPVDDMQAATHGRGLSEQELALGDYTPGRWAWKLEDVRAFDGPALKGKLGLWIPNARQHAQIFASYRKSFSPKP